HRTASLWGGPDPFAPDRFAPDLAKARPRFAFLPFGGGPRVCIGGGFAMLEATTILATIVRAFRFHPVAGHKPKPVAPVTLRPAGGLPLLITYRRCPP